MIAIGKTSKLLLAKLMYYYDINPPLSPYSIMTQHSYAAIHSLLPLLASRPLNVIMTLANLFGCPPNVNSSMHGTQS